MVSANKKTHYLELGNTGTKCYSSFLNWTDCKWKIKRSRWDKSNFIHSNDSIAKATNVHRKVKLRQLFYSFICYTMGNSVPRSWWYQLSPQTLTWRLTIIHFSSNSCHIVVTYTHPPPLFANCTGLRTNEPMGLQCIPLVLKVINTLLLLKARCLRLHQIEP